MRRECVTAALLACVVATTAAQVTDRNLLEPDSQDWLMYSGTYNSHRHSLLKQVTPANVARLQARWVYHMAGQETIQAVPVVYHGVMYISQFNRLDAIDARSGSIVWQYQRPPLTRGAQRGRSPKPFPHAGSGHGRWNGRSAVYQWQTQNAEAFIFGRADWEYVLNTFCFGYHVGYKFVRTGTGECNGNFLGIGADDCNRAVLVEQSAIYGLLITNGEFTSFHGDDPTMVEVMETNSGVVRFSNSAFWGPCNQIAKIAGQGTVGFSDCTFVEWRKDCAAIQASSGSLLIRGCDFRRNQPHISLGQSVDRAVITGNIFTGPAQIQNASTKVVQVGLNAAL